MRFHPAVLLVIVALTVPLVVELRTMAVWIGLELSVAQTLAIGAVVIGAIVAWAMLPERKENGSGASG